MNGRQQHWVAAAFLLPTLIFGQAANPGPAAVTLKGPDGKYSSYQLKPHPRIWLDGADGPITAAVRDPDGPGPQKSKRASGPYWDALHKRLERVASRADKDLTGGTALLYALGWYMDNQAKTADGVLLRTRALDQINKVEDVFISLGACDKTANYCGYAAIYPNSHISYMGFFLSYWAAAYTIMRSEMTDGERKAFAEKVLNGITKDIGGGCDNRLERMPGTFQLQDNGPTAAAKGEGTNWSPAMDGQWYYLKSAEQPNTTGIFVLANKVAGANDLTLQRPSLHSFYNKPLHLYRLKPWASGQCGMGWVANHYGNTPTYVTAYGLSKFGAAVGEADSTIQVATTDWIPKFTPFYMTVGPRATSEVIKVTAVEGNRLTVSRGEFSTTAKSWPAGTTTIFSSHMGDGDEMGWNNRTITRQVGHIMAALALADDDPRALDLLKTTVDYWYSNVWVAAHNYFTIVNTAATSYGMSRLLPFLLWSVESMYLSTTPALDYRGDWIKRVGADFYFYFSPPWDNKAFINWGIAADNCMSLAKAAEAQCAAPAVFLQSLYPGSPEASYAWNWLDEQGIPKDTNRLTIDSAERILVPLLLYGDPSLPRRDHRKTLLPHLVANTTDNKTPGATTNLSVVSSKTDWSPQASQFYILAADQAIQEFPDIVLSEKVVDAFNGDYGIGKDGWLLGQNRLGGYWMMYSGQQNVVDFGPLSRKAMKPFADIEIDRKKDTDARVLYVRADVKNGYSKAHQVLRGYRSYVHFKKPGETEHIVVYDDFASTIAQGIRSMLHYGNNKGAGEGDTSLNADASVIATDNLKARLFTSVVKVSGSGIVTDLNVIWKDKTATIGSYCTETNPCRAKIGTQVYNYTAPATIVAQPPATGKAEVYVWLKPEDGKIYATLNNATVQCQGGIECGSTATDFPADVIRLARLGWSNGKVTAACPGGTNATRGLEFNHCVGGNERHVFLDAGLRSTAAEFLVVHKVGGLDTTPDDAAALAELDQRFEGVQIGGANPKVALFAKEGLSHAELSFRTTHSGTAQYLIAGLTAGLYDVRRNGEAVASGVKVNGGDNSIWFESASGNITVQRQGGLPPLAFLTNELKPATAQEAYLMILAAEGGSAPYSWSVQASELPPGLMLSSKGSLIGTPTQAGTYSFTLAVYDASAHSVTQSFTLVVAEENKTLRVLTSSLDEGTRGEPFNSSLSAAGGTAPYRWEVSSGKLPEGLTLDPLTGDVSGVPTEEGEFSFTVLLTDSMGATAERTLMLSVTTP